MSEQTSEAPSVEYYHVWADDQGATHINKCKLNKFEFKEYAPPSDPQWVYTGELSIPEKVTFTNLPIGYFGDWHVNPVPQWVIPVKGTWWIETTDGTRVEMGPGVISYGEDQLGTKQSDGKIGHLTGVVGYEPVTLMVIRCEEQSMEEMQKLMNKPGHFD